MARSATKGYRADSAASMPDMRLNRRGSQASLAAITALTGITALYMGLVVFGNITDYETNHAFVQHVFAMDTTGYGRSTRPATRTR